MGSGLHKKQSLYCVELFTHTYSQNKQPPLRLFEFCPKMLILKHIFIYKKRPTKHLFFINPTII